MNLYTKLAANFLFPLHEKLKGHSTIEVFREMEKTQWLPPADIDRLQLENLKAFLTDIGIRVPYYRKLFRTLDFDPTQVSSTEDLQQLPLAGKAEIRANMEQLKADGTTGLQRFNTGGSTGEPLIFYLGKQRVSHDVAAKRRATRWWGVDIGDAEIVVWGSPIELGSQDRVRMIRDKIFRTELLSAFEMSDTKLDTFVQRLRKQKPAMLFGYPSAIALISQHAVSRNIRLDDLGVKVVFVTSEKLYDYQREQIQKAFGCPVANGYGGRDAGFIAHQCPAGCMHITAEDIVVEIVDEHGQVLPPGSSGEIVVTHMATGDFPFVRYPTGDVGVLREKPCSCGRGLPVLDEIQGRSTDFIVSPDGTRLHGLSLIYVLRDLPGIGAFKIVQESTELLWIQLVVDASYSSVTEELITTQFRRRLGELIEIKFEYLEQIAAEKSGKYRYVVSHVEMSNKEVSSRA